MSSIATSSIVLACAFGGALFGMLLRKFLPQDHLSDESKTVVRLAMGLVATMTAMVLGLLISQAKSSFDTQSNEITGTSSKFILLDRALAGYGPETKETRDLLRSVVADLLDQMEQKKHERVAVPAREVDSVYQQIQGLSAKDDRHRSFQADALNLLKEIRQTRWLVYEQRFASISMPMLIILVSWLIALFISFGLYAPANGTVLTSLFVAALSVSGAILLILEMYSPYTGLIQVSSAPFSNALMQMGK